MTTPPGMPDCPTCHGTGRMPAGNNCPTCGGTGTKPGNRYTH
jgi:DnaJ-class molecular chaperone